MGFRDRMRRERIQRGEEPPISKQKDDTEKFLDKAVGLMGGGIKQQMLDGAKSGMQDQAKRMRKKGQPVTKEHIMKEITGNPRLLSIAGKAGVTMADFERLADEVLEEICSTQAIV